MFDDQMQHAELSENSNVEGLLVSIKSGGSVVGAEKLYWLRNIAKEKPVVVVIGEVGASAAILRHWVAT